MEAARRRAAEHRIRDEAGEGISAPMRIAIVCPTKASAPSGTTTVAAKAFEKDGDPGVTRTPDLPIRKLGFERALA